jgi:hypothetical protein
MKIKIGNYINYFGCYQLAEKLLFWKDENSDEVMALGEWLAGKDNDSWLQKTLTKLYDKRKRTIKIHIDTWDTYSADSTLALIILPVLKQIQEDKRSAGFVDDDDVPEEIRSVDTPDGDLDPNFFKRWEYVIGEMVFAYEHIVDTDWENEYWKEDEPNIAGMEVVNARISKGLILFGKYYRGLWT